MPFFRREPQSVQLGDNFRENIELPTRSNGHATPANPDNNGFDNKNPALDPRILQAASRRKWYVLAAVFLSFTLFSGVAYKKPNVSALWRSKFIVQDSNIYLLLPNSGAAGDIDVQLCRTLLGASVLGYPTPWVVTYETGRSETKRVYDFINMMTQPDDMVIVAQDSWFQLRSEVLIQRYFDIVTKTNKAISKGKLPGPYQAVLLAKQEQSPGTNLIMGPAADMRHVFGYASENNFDLAQTYANQQSEHAGRPSRLARRQEGSDQSGANDNGAGAADLGIGLDEDHLLLANFKDLHAYRAGEKADLASSAPPFWTPAGSVTANLPNSSWTQIDVLSTDDSRHSVPALIEYDTAVSKDELKSAWATLWYHEHARKLLTFAAGAPATPLAIVIDAQGEKKVERRYWSTIVPSRGEKDIGVKRTGDNELHKWSQICGGDSEAQDIFGDGQGKWENPRW